MMLTEPGTATAADAAVVLSLTDPRWIEFVTHNGAATAFHLPAWTTAVAECYRFPAFALAVTSPAGVIVAGSPVVAVPRPLRRRGRPGKWVALPFTDHCPPLFADGIDRTTWSERAGAALDASGVPRMELRADVSGGSSAVVGVRHVLQLSADPSEVHRGFHRSQVQRNIRRAGREGVVVRVADRRADLTEIFYRLHLATRRRQGVPVQPRRFFRLIWQHVIAAGHGAVLIAEHAGRPVAAAVFLRHNGTVIYKYGASDDAAWPLRPNHALFWHAIVTACEAGDRRFDWGRTELGNAGLRSFKSAWGAVEEPLRYTTIGGPAATHDLGGSPAARALAATIRHTPPWTCAAAGKALYRFTA